MGPMGLRDIITKFLGPTGTPPEKATPALKSDSWFNAALGYGTAYDKVSAGIFYPSYRLTDMQLSALYYGDPIAATMVDYIPDETFRRGYELKSETNQAAANALIKRGQDLKVDKCVQDAMRWGRLFGGALVHMGVNDGAGSLAKPLRPEASKEIQFLQVVDKRYASVVGFEQDPLRPDIGDAETYRLTPLLGGLYDVHASRVLRFEGVPVDSAMYRQLAGWTFSVLQRPYDRMRQFAMAYDSAGALLSDANQGVFKMKGLWHQIVEGGKDALQKRMAMVDYTRSSMKSVLIDADGEDFNRVVTSFAGIPDLLDRFMMLLSASTGIPVTILMGRSAAGMNSTGDSDFRAFYDRVAAFQTRVLTPMLLEIYGMVGEVPSDLCLEWLPLWEPSEKEQADTKLVEAQAAKTEAEEYQVWITAQVLMPEEVALAEFSDATDGEIEIDVKARQQSLEQETELALNPPEPPVLPPTPGAPPLPPGSNGPTS